MELCCYRSYSLGCIVVRYVTSWNGDSTMPKKLRVRRTKIGNGGWMAFSDLGNSHGFHAAA